MNNRLPQILDQLYNSNKLPWIIIGIGIILRLIRYLYNPSLWFDEGVLVGDIANRSLSELIHPSPDYSQTGPLGFFVLIKLAIQAFGTSEYALRLFPLFFGIISLFFFFKVSVHYLKPKAVLIAIGLFAVSEPLILQSTNLKPYSGDIAFTLFIYLFTIYLQSNKLNIFNVILFGLSGAVIVWFSHPSVFVLGGVGLTLVIFCLIRKDWINILRLSVICLIWGLSFVAFYFIYTSHLMNSIEVTFGLNTFLDMENSLMPFPPKSLKDMNWFFESFFVMFNAPVGLYLKGIAALTFIVGCISLYAENRERLFLLISPVLLTLFASAIHKYPFSGRLILFLVPAILLLIAAGAAEIKDKLKQISPSAGAVIIVLLFLHPLSMATYHTTKPFVYEDIKPVMQYIEDNWQEGDIIYVHYYAQYPFMYYTQYHPNPFNFKEDEYVIGVAPRGWYNKWRKQELAKYFDSKETIVQKSFDIFNKYEQDINQLIGNKRVWILFSGVISRDGIVEENFFVYHLEKIGKRLDLYKRYNVSTVYLYDLSQ